MRMTKPGRLRERILRASLLVLTACGGAFDQAATQGGDLPDASGGDAASDAAGGDAPDAQASGGCIPTTCQAQAANCGKIPDGCGGVMTCGSCPAGKNCGGGGPNACGDGTCTPETCASQAKNCGL